MSLPLKITGNENIFNLSTLLFDLKYSHNAFYDTCLKFILKMSYFKTQGFNANIALYKT